MQYHQVLPYCISYEFQILYVGYCNIDNYVFQVKEAIFKTLIRNGMFDNAHIRLSLTRGKKVCFYIPLVRISKCNSWKAQI